MRSIYLYIQRRRRKRITTLPSNTTRQGKGPKSQVSLSKVHDTKQRARQRGPVKPTTGSNESPTHQGSCTVPSPPTVWNFVCSTAISSRAQALSLDPSPLQRTVCLAPARPNRRQLLVLVQRASEPLTPDLLLRGFASFWFDDPALVTKTSIHLYNQAFVASSRAPPTSFFTLLLVS